ncbi:hypothetical protein M885DRAFT_221132 [Pelagophyceae sp. CCMP2097]|nr:hypothetical protein M885DRAFT_221132 [Pelagophyceae sp. CCMP2097]
MAACAGILLAWLAVRCAAQDVEGPSCAAAAVRKSGPSHVLFWKLRRTGSTTLCAQLTAYAESTGRSYLSDSTTRPSDSAPRGGGAAAVLCQSRPPHSWLAQHRGTALQLVMLRDPAQMAWSLYYFNLNNPKASQRVPGMANTWAEAGFAAELNGTAPRDLEAARMQLSLTIPTAPRAVAWFQAYFGDGAGLAARREAAPPAAPQRAAPAARAAGAAPRPRNLSAGGGARSLLDGARAGPMDATRAGNRSAFDHFGGANFVYDWAAPNGRPGTIADALREVEAEGAKIKCLIFEKMDESIALVQLYLGDVARPEIASTRHKCFRTPRAPFESWPAEVHEWYRTAPLAVAAKKLYAAFESRFEAQIDAVGRDKHDSAVRCLRSMQKEKGASEKGPGRFKMITEKEASRGLSGRVWLVSHGGVGSEYLRGLLDPDEAKKNNANSPLFLSKEPVGPKARPMRSVLAHLGRPVDVGPKLAIYLYGGAALSVTSQIGRHPVRPSETKRRIEFPETSSDASLVRTTRPSCTTTRRILLSTTSLISLPSIQRTPSASPLNSKTLPATARRTPSSSSARTPFPQKSSRSSPPSCLRTREPPLAWPATSSRSARPPLCSRPPTRSASRRSTRPSKASLRVNRRSPYGGPRGTQRSGPSAPSSTTATRSRSCSARASPRKSTAAGRPRSTRSRCALSTLCSLGSTRFTTSASRATSPTSQPCTSPAPPRRWRTRASSNRRQTRGQTRVRPRPSRLRGPFRQTGI